MFPETLSSPDSQMGAGCNSTPASQSQLDLRGRYTKQTKPTMERTGDGSERGGRLCSVSLVSAANVLEAEGGYCWARSPGSLCS